MELALDVVVEVIGRADHREDLAGLGVHREEVTIVGAQRTQLLLADGYRLLSGLLQTEVERRGHDEAALVDGGRPVRAFQLLEHVVHEVRRLAAAVLLEHKLEWFALGLLGLGAGDHAAVHHGVEHDRLPRERPVFMQRRIEIGGAIWKAGEQRRLTERQVLGVLSKVDLRSGLNAGRAVATIASRSLRKIVFCGVCRMAIFASCSVMVLAPWEGRRAMTSMMPALMTRPQSTPWCCLKCLSSTAMVAFWRLGLISLNLTGMTRTPWLLRCSIRLPLRSMIWTLPPVRSSLLGSGRVANAYAKVPRTSNRISARTMPTTVIQWRRILSHS